MITHIIDEDGNKIPIEDFLQKRPEFINIDENFHLRKAYVERFKRLAGRKPDYDSKDIFNEDFKHCIDAFYSEEFKKIQTKEYDLVIFLDMYQLLLNALKTRKADNLINKIQYKYFKSRIEELIGVIQLEQKYSTKKINESTQSVSDFMDRVWFKAGIHIANGDLYRMRKEKQLNGRLKSFDFIAGELGNKSYAPYFSSSFDNSTPDRNKNIYFDPDHTQIIYEYCIENNIELCDEFLDKYNTIQHESKTIQK
ncbi:polysaccharide deacetylase family protein [Chryseobacterium aurantiacum]|uniref:hypothetical protein n=1 Tax=Chryseobacterium aurantiacum TaxID=2116499 RepID=UPI000D12E292|nr:hypothetical protein [Chryseobacterium aurantiacum]